MAYEGQVGIIPLGKGALLTDMPQTDVPLNRLIRAENVSLYRGILEKDFGSRRWNAVQVPYQTNPNGTSFGIRRAFDYWPTDYQQRIFVLTKDGALYRFTDPYNMSLVPGNTTQYLRPGNFCQITVGGSEQLNNPRKLFIFDGYDCPQVIEGDATEMTNMTNPASDWSTGNYPIAGVVHESSLWCYGSQNNPHTVYRSSATDHEDFTTSPFTMTIFPGEGEGIVSHFTWLGRLFFCKYPSGLYYINENGTPTQTDWQVAKSFDTFGGVSPQGCVNVFNDVIIANSYGGLTSINSTNFFGDVLNSDLMAQAGCLEYIRNEVRLDNYQERQGIYYQDKKELLYLYTGSGSALPDRIIAISYKDPNNPQVRIITKDIPTCLFLIKDGHFVQRPAYGCDDGYVYLMDQQDRQLEDVGNNTLSGYQMIAWTPDIDLGAQNPPIAELTKNFDFLEVVYEPTGRYTLNIDVYIDGRFHRTLPFLLNGDTVLGEFHLGGSTQESCRISGRNPKRKTLDLKGLGRRISFKIYDPGIALQNFRLIELRVYYRVASTQQKD